MVGAIRAAPSGRLDMLAIVDPALPVIRVDEYKVSARLAGCAEAMPAIDQLVRLPSARRSVRECSHDQTFRHVRSEELWPVDLIARELEFERANRASHRRGQSIACYAHAAGSRSHRYGTWTVGRSLRPPEPPFPRLPPQRRLARTRTDGPRPHPLDPTPPTRRHARATLGAEMNRPGFGGHPCQPNRVKVIAVG